MMKLTLKTNAIRITSCIALGFSMSGFFAYEIIQSHFAEVQDRSRAMTATRSSYLDLKGKPNLSQESIRLAMVHFNIERPEAVLEPKLDLGLADRGLTIRKGAWQPPVVAIGPDAFASWPLLGSTLAHELEIHCKQNLVAIHIMNLTGLNGTTIAEREAYDYELNQANRFGLSPYDRDLIKSTADYYYPRKTFSLSEIPSIKLVMQRLSGFGLSAKN
jgi:hypothetical protein